jgi:DNA repair protein RecO (recombination protein O)
MLHKTRGIVFRFTKYGESSIIATIFTEIFGIQSYIVNSVRSKAGKNKIALYQPLTLLDLVVYHRANANINRIKEVKCLYPFQSIHTNIRKSGIAMFIIEVINKTVKEESHAQQLCDFFIRSLITLDQMENSENFHLIFLLKLSRLLGFGAHHVNDVLGIRVTSEDNEKVIEGLLKADYLDTISMQNQQRREIIELIMKFYKDHMENLGDMKSIQVLREIL